MFYRLISVLSSPDRREELERYLYDHSRIIAVIPSPENLTRVEFLVLTVSTVSDANANYLADYQAGRLTSGLFGARVLDNLS